ncbi:MAG: UDP-4-amino-4-deoxy-L-arabinose--oxoglutarate aminotransferase [bacterium]|nr:UDP-4-amino-4-deoxy-L-arabinose--oxoglutarate aminotransferase [bacterium]
MKTHTLHEIQVVLSKFFTESSMWDMSLAGTAAVYRLEQRFASLVGQPYALAVSNATMGLWAIFAALDITGAEIIVTPYTWGGSLSGLILNGNRPVFADIDKDTLTLDPRQIVQAITTKSRAILAVDIYGYPCDGPALRQIADEYGLLLIQDCAQSFGAFLRDHHTGWWADAAVYSLSWGKALYAGEGGVIVTGNIDLYNKLVWETQHPVRQLRDIPHMPVNELAANLRIHPLAALWADAIFDDCLFAVEVRRHECMRALALLQNERLIASNVPKDSLAKPAFQAVTFVPGSKEEEITLFLQAHQLRYEVSLPPIVEPVYFQKAYQSRARSHKWFRHNACRIAEQQCRSRLALYRKT